jgi:hypothetical protein
LKRRDELERDFAWMICATKRLFDDLSPQTLQCAAEMGTKLMIKRISKKKSLLFWAFSNSPETVLEKDMQDMLSRSTHLVRDDMRRPEFFPAVKILAHIHFQPAVKAAVDKFATRRNGGVSLSRVPMCCAELVVVACQFTHLYLILCLQH